jgi:integrase
VDLLPYMSKRLALPDKIPFHQVKFYKRQSAKYESTFNVEELLMKAQDELIGIEQDQQWIILVIAVCSGLRRGEIDRLTWNQVLFDHKKIFLGTTEVFDPKSDSGVSVPMDDDLITLLRSHKEKHGGEYVIQSDVKPLFNTSTPHYRADRHEKALIKWLRKNGNDAHKPIHTLRKEAGSLVTQKYGLHAASLFLRHADIQVTSDHYVDSTKPSSTGLSSLLTGKESK